MVERIDRYWNCVDWINYANKLHFGFGSFEILFKESDFFFILHLNTYGNMTWQWYDKIESDLWTLNERVNKCEIKDQKRKKKHDSNKHIKMKCVKCIDKSVSFVDKQLIYCFCCVYQNRSALATKRSVFLACVFPTIFLWQFLCLPMHSYLYLHLAASKGYTYLHCSCYDRIFFLKVSFS